MQTDRKADLRNYLFDHGQTAVVDLAQVLGTSIATVRRDLTELANAGLVERLHGAARITQSAGTEAAFGVREAKNLSSKRAIASLAAGMIRPGSTVFLDAGTTVLQLARKIRLARVAITVFTNGLVVAQELAQVPQVTLCLLGGRVRSENMSVLGPLAERMLEDLWFDQLFLGASAIADDGAVTSFDPDEARGNAHMAARSAQVMLLADHSKFSQRATYGVFHLSNREQLLTDRPLPAALDRHVAAVGCRVWFAPDAGDANG